MGTAGSPEAICAEVAALLGTTAETIDPGDNLIAHGLDSIRMMALAGRWRRQGIAVDFATLAAAPTVAAWSQLVSGRGQSAAEQRTLGPPAPAPIAEESDAFPLAPMQHAMWIGRQEHQQLGGVAGHLYVEFDGGPIDPDRLRAAAAVLARRHPMLRARFLPDGTQRIAAATASRVYVHDLRDLATAAVDQRLAALRAAKSHQQLDGEVFELAVTLLPGQRSRLHVDLDMQAADAMSYRTLMADLAALYAGDQLPDLGYTYREYRLALEAAEAQPQPARDADREWWAQRLPELPDPPALPSMPGRTAHTSSRRWHWLNPATCDALFSRARARGITPAMALAAAFSHAVARWSTHPRFLLNVPLFGRQALHPDVDRVVGDFTSSLLLDIDLSAAGTAAARAHRVQNAMRNAAAHSAYSGLSVLRDLSRHRGAQVLAPVVFTSALGLGDLFSSTVTDQFGSPEWIISQGPQVLLDAQVTEFDGGVLINWDVRDGGFPPGVVDAMFAHHINELLVLAAGDTAWDAADAPVLPAGQRAVRDAVNSRTAQPSGEALHDGFFRQAELRPDAPAVLAGSGGLTYRQLRQQVWALMAALRAAGIGRRDTVAVLGPKTAEQIPALLAILAVGASYLPIGVDQPRDRAERILATGSARLALVCGDQRLALPVPELMIADVLRNPPVEAELNCAAVDPADLAYTLFTSGSTGEPKGVEVTHDAAMNTVESIGRHFDIGPADRCLALSALECDLSVLDIFVNLRTGGSIVVVDETQRRDPDAWARLIDSHRITVLNFMPGWLEMLTEVGRERLSSLRVIPTGGDWVRPELARRLKAEAPDLRFAGLGGATETAVHATLFEVHDPDQLPSEWTGLPFGVPLPNITCRVVNEWGHDCPDWVAGELWVTGRGIARGYRGRPDLTADRFVEHDGRVWYRTGDLARYWPDGTIEFVGRVDHRVKISGYRVELGEVEAMLRRVPGVHAAVAAVVPANSGDALAAAVRVDDPALSAERIRAALSNLVPPHMIPRHLTLLDRIPYTDAGKLDRRAVTALLTPGLAGAETGHRPCATAVEAALAAIIGTVLGVDPVHPVQADDDFFTLGGDSVLATQAVARIRTWLDTPDIMVADIFAGRTVAALAARLTAHQPDPGRLEQVAELYLEISGMDAGEVLSAATESATTQ